MRISDWSSDVCSSDLDEQQAAAAVGQRAVHPALVVGEDPVAEQALRHPLHLRVTVAQLDADQRQQPGADGAEGVAVDGDAGGGDALDEGEHGWLGLGAGGWGLGAGGWGLGTGSWSWGSSALVRKSLV